MKRIRIISGNDGRKCRKGEVIGDNWLHPEKFIDRIPSKCSSGSLWLMLSEIKCNNKHFEKCGDASGCRKTKKSEKMSCLFLSVFCFCRFIFCAGGLLENTRHSPQ